MLREGAGSREHRVLDSHLCSTDRCPMLEGLGGVLSPVPETSPLFYILCIIVCLRGGGGRAHMWKSEANILLSFYPMDSRDGTQDFWPNSSHLYLLSHFPGPQFKNQGSGDYKQQSAGCLVFVNMCSKIELCVCVHIYVYMSLYISHTHTNTHTHTHTYIYIHTFIYTP